MQRGPRFPALGLLCIAAIAIAGWLISYSVDESHQSISESHLANTPSKNHEPLVASPKKLTTAPVTLRSSKVRKKLNGGRFTVTALTQSGVPLAQAVLMVTDGRSKFYAGTDAAGRATICDIPFDGSYSASIISAGRLLPGIRASADRARTCSFPITEQSLDIIHPQRILLTFHAVDATTGMPLEDGVIRLADRSLLADPNPTIVDAQEPIRLPIGTRLNVSFDVQAPGGTIAADPMSISSPISIYAKRVEMHYPLRQEALIYANDNWPTRTSQLPELLDVSVEYRDVGEPKFESSIGNRVRIRGIPHFPNTRLSVRAQFFSGEVTESYTHTTMPKDAWIPIELDKLITVALGKNLQHTSSWGRHTRIDSPIDWPTPRFGGKRTTEGTARATVTVVRRNGEPARGSTVSIAGQHVMTDAYGRATLSTLPDGRHRVFAALPGMVCAKSEIHVSAGRPATDLRLTEPKGLTIDLAVEDHRGTPTPYAQVYVAQESGNPWVDLQDGVQRLDRYTDYLGKKRLCHVEPGKIKIIVAWACKRHEASFELRDASIVHELRIRMKDPLGDSTAK